MLENVIIQNQIWRYERDKLIENGRFEGFEEAKPHYWKVMLEYNILAMCTFYDGVTFEYLLLPSEQLNLTYH